MTRRLQLWTAFALVLSVLVILFSPFAAFQSNALRTRQNLRLHAVVAPLALYAPLAAWLVSSSPAAWETEAQLALPGTAIVALTCARLC